MTDGGEARSHAGHMVSVSPEPVTRTGGPPYRCSTCGGPARFGYGVSLRQGEEGTWYCREHLPLAVVVSQPAGDSTEARAGQGRLL